MRQLLKEKTPYQWGFFVFAQPRRGVPDRREGLSPLSLSGDKSSEKSPHQWGLFFYIHVTVQHLRLGMLRIPRWG